LGLKKLEWNEKEKEKLSLVFYHNFINFSQISMTFAVNVQQPTRDVCTHLVNIVTKTVQLKV